MSASSGVSGGTTDETIDPSTPPSRMSRSPSMVETRPASSSAVSSASVAKRQCSRSSASSKTPTWLCVFPTSIASSTALIIATGVWRIACGAMAAGQSPAATLYVIPGSHPSMAVRRMLELKGIPYRRRDLMPLVSRAVLWALRFPGYTAPSLAIGGRKMTGSREIARELERIRPEPPLYPADAEKRAMVTEAEHWGEEVLQPAVRRILWNALSRDRAPLATYAEGYRLGVPIGLAVRTAAPIVAAEKRVNDAGDEAGGGDPSAPPRWGPLARPQREPTRSTR